MRALLQRVTRAAVDVDGETIGDIGRGVLVLVCAMQDDDRQVAEALAKKISKLRIFQDDTGKMNRSLVDVDGGALVVSQFTLAADTKRGNRPGFSQAAQPDQGAALYHHFADSLKDLNISVSLGRFGADMQVSLVNDGPVTIWLDTDT